MDRIPYIQHKYKKVKRLLAKYGGAVVAFSGGVDSTLLLKLAIEVLKHDVIAVTGVSPLHPKQEIAAARRLARSLGSRHILISTREVDDPRFSRNTKNHCYFCKYKLFSRLKKIASEHGYTVIEGSNKSDLAYHRPGLNALKRLSIISPFVETGMTKKEIRELARTLHLPNWNKPSMACLASRIPYGKKIDKKTLKRIEQAEQYLKKLALTQIRVRDHFPIAKIEVRPDEFSIILDHSKSIDKYFRGLGYKYTALDLAGYQTGCFDK